MSTPAATEGTTAPATRSPSGPAVGAPLPLQHARLARACTIGLVLAALAQAGISLLPPLPLSATPGLPSPPALHLLMELFAVIIATLVVTVTWHSAAALPRAFTAVVVCGYTVVASADVLHALTYHGMPRLFAADVLGQGVFFWLAGRTAELLTAAALAARLSPSWSRGRALAIALVVSALLLTWGGWWLDWFPATIVPGVGLTGFKVGFEVALIAGNVLVAAALWRQARRTGSDAGLLLAAASALMAIGGLSFASYTAPHDAQNLLGHLFKIGAYALLFRATFVAGMRAPLDALQASRRHASRVERQLDGLVATATDAILVLDADLRLQVCNASASRMFGIAPAGAIGRALADLVDLGELAPALRQPPGAPVAVEARCSDGRAFPVEASVSSFGDGPDRLVTIVARDMTLAREAEASRAAQRAAELASEAKSLFLARVSHELRTPLNAVIGGARLLQLGATRGDPLSDPQARRTALILQGGEHLLRIVDDLIDIGCAQGGELRVQLRPAQVQPIVRAAVALSESLAREKGVRLEPPSEMADPVVQVDAARLKQVLLNLLSNAIKYNRHGGQVTVQIATQADGRVVITVADNGLGMDTAQLQRLFQPFDRLGREHSTVQGVGIGLALSQQLVVAMGGQITAQSTVFEGTTMRVFLHPADLPAD